MRKHIRNFLIFFKLHKLFQLLNRNRVIILMYHGFTDKQIHEGIENYGGKHINNELFREQIRYLKKNYNVISLNQYIESCIRGEKLPFNSLIITIDDGYKSNYTLAFPVFKEFDVPATIFLTTDFIDNKNFLWVDRLEYAINNTKLKELEFIIGDEKLYFTLRTKEEKIFCDRSIRSKIKSIENVTPGKIIQQIENQLDVRILEASKIPPIYLPLDWNEIVEMIKTSKVDIGSHTHNHLVLAKHKNEIIQNELSLSKKVIEKNTGIETRLFCYPNGFFGDFNDITKQFIKASGYCCALTTVNGTNDEISDLYELKRFGIGNDDLETFFWTTSGTRYYVNNMRRIKSIRPRVLASLLQIKYISCTGDFFSASRYLI